jgi:sugar-specific transcriptional regulator TrmB
LNRDEWIQKLKKMGLSGYEAQVYLALLGESRAPASRVVRKSGVPQSKVYGALSSLVERGFAEQVLGDVKLYRGIPPHQAFDNYRRSVEESLGRSRSDMSDLARAAPAAPGEDPGILGIRLVRPRQMRSVIEEAKKTADTELLIALKDPLVIVPDLPQDLKLLQRGIKLRYVAEVATLSDPIYGPALREEATKADMFRFVEQVVFRFSVRDERVATIELNEDDGTTMALVVPNKGLAANMTWMFDSLWEQGKAISEFPAPVQASYSA